MCYLRSIDDKDDVLMEVTEILLQKQTLAEILEEAYKLQIAQPTYRQILAVLQIM